MLEAEKESIDTVVSLEVNDEEITDRILQRAKIEGTQKTIPKMLLGIA